MCEAIAGKADDEEFAALAGSQIERFRTAGNLDAVQGLDEWRMIARALCSAELEALARVEERDEGDFTGTPTTPLIANAQPPEDKPEPVKLSKLWREYVHSRMHAGFMRDKGSRQEPMIENLRQFMRHDEAARMAKKDLIAWRDRLLTTLAARTVSDVYLSRIRILIRWAGELSAKSVS